MIDFGLSEEQTALQAAARELLAAECPPALVRETAKAADGVPRGLYRRMAEQGWFGLLVPEREGGVGLGILDLALVLEELGRVAAPGPFLSTQLVIAALVRAGSAAQRRAWLPRLTAGEAFAALAYLEESDQHDPAGIEATARRTRGGWRLGGTKLFALEAPGADVLLVAARGKAGPGSAGVSLFLVERAAPGLRVRSQETMDLTRRIGEVVLHDVEVGPDALLGPDGGGWPLLARLLDVACVGVAADSLGGAARALEMAVAYAQVREQFGRKIGSFQAIKHLLAEMVAEVEPARSLVWYAAHALDRRPREAARLAAMAKASLGDVYSRTTRRAVEVHGGIGFTWEHDLHLWFKRAHLSEALFGDPRFHRERLATIDGY
ncbi:MAG TPA: acyl-CoA dehydrogenase family protein [Candidatus Binatia bacterium]|nr:acyl-CoA dehydrogenase family protein [Candidatus Binatia bacterium]